MTLRHPAAILAILLLVAGCGRLGPPVRAAQGQAADSAASGSTPETDDEADEDEDER